MLNNSIFNNITSIDKSIMDNIVTASTRAGINYSIGYKNCLPSIVNEMIYNKPIFDFNFDVKPRELTQKEISDKNKKINDRYRSMIKDVFYNKKKNATTVSWSDGTYTTVKLSPGDVFDPYHAITLCMAKKLCGNRLVANEIIAKWGDKYFEDEVEEAPAENDSKSKKKKKKV